MLASMALIKGGASVKLTVLGKLLQKRNALFITCYCHFMSLNCKALHYFCITFAKIKGNMDWNMKKNTVYKRYRPFEVVRLVIQQRAL